MATGLRTGYSVGLGGGGQAFGSVPRQEGSAYTTTNKTGVVSSTGNRYNPETDRWEYSGAQRGTNAGEALRALAESSGLPLLSMFGGSGGGPGGGAGSLPPVTMPDVEAANTAAFARAKDRAGQTGAASIKALTQQMANRGLLGSNLEAAGQGEVVGRIGAGLQEFDREKAIQDAKNISDRAMTEYQGRITQRGQDISVASAAAARQQAVLQGLLDAVGGRGILY